MCQWVLIIIKLNVMSKKIEFNKGLKDMS